MPKAIRLPLFELEMGAGGIDEPAFSEAGHMHDHVVELIQRGQGRVNAPIRIHEGELALDADGVEQLMKEQGLIFAVTILLLERLSG